MELNVIICKNYNADFDGDEMNFIVVTNQRSLAEAEIISSISNRIVSPSNGTLVIK